MQILGCF